MKQKIGKKISILVFLDFNHRLQWESLMKSDISILVFLDFNQRGRAQI